MAIDLSTLTNTVSEAAQEQGMTNGQAATPAVDYAAELAKLQAENAKLKAVPAAKPATPQTTAPKAVILPAATPKPRVPDTPLPDAQIPRFVGGKFTGSYPEGCSPQEKMILVAIHACKSKPKADGTKYDVMCTWSHDLYSFLRVALIPNVFSDFDALKTVMFPLIDSMEKKGIITTQCKGKNKPMMYFDGREHPKATSLPRLNVPVTNELAAAFKAAFAAA